MLKQPTNRIDGPCSTNENPWDITETRRPSTVRQLNNDFAEGLHEESILVRVLCRSCHSVFRLINTLRFPEVKCEGSRYWIQNHLTSKLWIQFRSSNEGHGTWPGWIWTRTRNGRFTLSWWWRLGVLKTWSTKVRGGFNSLRPLSVNKNEYPISLDSGHLLDVTKSSSRYTLNAPYSVCFLKTTKNRKLCYLWASRLFKLSIYLTHQ